MTEPTHSQLIDAVNMLCEYVDEHLPKGYTITLTLRNDDSFLELDGPDGAIEIEPEPLVSSVAVMCRDATEQARKSCASQT